MMKRLFGSVLILLITLTACSKESKASSQPEEKIKPVYYSEELHPFSDWTIPTISTVEKTKGYIIEDTEKYKYFSIKNITTEIPAKDKNKWFNYRKKDKKIIPENIPELLMLENQEQFNKAFNFFQRSDTNDAVSSEKELAEKIELLLYSEKNLLDEYSKGYYDEDKEKITDAIVYKVIVNKKKEPAIIICDSEAYFICYKKAIIGPIGRITQMQFYGDNNDLIYSALYRIDKNKTETRFFINNQQVGAVPGWNNHLNLLYEKHTELLKETDSEKKIIPDYADIDFFKGNELIKSFAVNQIHKELKAKEFKQKREQLLKKESSKFNAEIWATKDGLTVAYRLEDLESYETISYIYEQDKLALHCTDKYDIEKLIFFEKNKEPKIITAADFNRYKEIPEYEVEAKFKLIRFKQEKLIYYVELNHTVKQDDILIHNKWVADSELNKTGVVKDTEGRETIYSIEKNWGIIYFSIENNVFFFGDKKLRSSPDFFNKSENNFYWS